MQGLLPAIGGDGRQGDGGHAVYGSSGESYAVLQQPRLEPYLPSRSHGVDFQTVPSVHYVDQVALARVEIPFTAFGRSAVEAFVVVWPGIQPTHRVFDFEYRGLALAMRRDELRESQLQTGLHCPHNRFHRRLFRHLLVVGEPVQQQGNRHGDDSNSDGELDQRKPGRPAAAPRHFLPSAAVPRSQIGRKTPSASTSTTSPRLTTSTGSICEASDLRSYSTSRWYMSAISDMSSSSAPVSSPTATICSTMGVKMPVSTAVRRTDSPRSTPPRIASILRATCTLSTVPATIVSACTAGTPLLTASAKLRAKRDRVALSTIGPAIGIFILNSSHAIRPGGLRIHARTPTTASTTTTSRTGHHATMKSEIGRAHV